MGKLVSIIVPVYKTAPYVEQAVKSIQNQTYKNIEIILVDDGSPDNSGLICDNLAAEDHRIRVVHKLNGGSSDARNVALHVAKGELIMYMDSDDYWGDSSTILESLVEMITVYWEDCDFLIFNYKQYYQQEKLLENNRTYPVAFLKGKNKYEKFNFFASIGHFPMSAWSKLIKRDLLVNNDIHFIKGICGEDIPWFVELIDKCKNFEITNDYLYTYRKQVPGTITSQFSNKKYNDLITIVENCTQKVLEKNYNPELAEAIFAFMAYEYAILIAQSLHIEKNKWSKYHKWLKKYRWLLKYAHNRKTTLVKICLKIVGIRYTGYILNLYIKKFVNRSI